MATVLDDAGSARTIADQLGHTQPSLTQNVHMGRKIASTKAQACLISSTDRVSAEFKAVRGQGLAP